MTHLPPELVSAVLADPGDETPRLACADWLDEQGDADAGAFVRLGVRLMRRDALRLSTREISQLSAERDRLTKLHRERWLLAPLGLASAAGVWAAWDGGFVSRLRVTGRCLLPAEQLFARMSAFPLLASLLHRPARPVPASALAALPALPRLTELVVSLSPAEPDDAVSAALAAQPRLRAAWLTPPNDNGVGGRPVTPGEWGRIRAARVAAVRAAPADRLVDAIRPHAESLDVTRGGLVRLNLGEAGAALAGDAAVMGRVPNLSAVALVTAAAPDWLARHPRLAGLSLDGLARFDAGPLAGLTGLRQVRIGAGALGEADVAALFAWLATLPRLAALEVVGATRAGRPNLIHTLLSWLPARRGRRDAPAVRLPALRVLDTAGLGLPPIDAPLLLGRLAPGAPQRVAGVTLRLPAGFVRLPLPPSDGSGVEALATWAEWGDGDALDRVPEAGPAWVRLERLTTRVRVADAGRILTGPPGELARVQAWAGLRREPGEPPRSEIAGVCPFAEHFRAVWSGKTSALRLRIERPRRRATPFAALARLVASSLKGEVDG